MVKMVPHRIVRETSATKPVLDLLGDAFSIDGSDNIVDIACEKVAIVPLATSVSPVMSFLVEGGHFDYHDDANSLYLPIDKRQAALLERSPYGDPPIDSYICIFAERFSQILSTETFTAARSGDSEALKALLDWLRNFQVTCRGALETAKLFIAFAYSPEDRAGDEAEQARRPLQ